MVRGRESMVWLSVLLGGMYAVMGRVEVEVDSEARFMGLDDEESSDSPLISSVAEDVVVVVVDNDDDDDGVDSEGPGSEGINSSSYPANAAAVASSPCTIKGTESARESTESLSASFLTIGSLPSRPLCTAT